MLPLTAALYASSVLPLHEEALYAAAYAAASPQRREKTQRLRFADDRALSLGAEALLRYALRQAGYTGPLTFTYGPQGKPRLPEGAPQFSLSHAGDYVLCALGPCEVGCDIEKIGPADLALARRFFCPEEAAAIAGGPTPQAQSVLFYRYWTLKESFLKVTGQGLSLPLDAFSVTLGDEIAVHQTVDARHCRFSEFSQVPGYACAVCTADGPCPREIHMVEMREILQEVMP